MTLRRDAAGGVCSLGRAMLNAQLEHMTQKEVARAVSRFTRKRVSQSTISKLATGRLVTDSYELRRALERQAGIPIDAWDQAADDCAA